MNVAVARLQAWGLLLLLSLGAAPAQATIIEADFTWSPAEPSTADVLKLISTTNSTRPIVNCDWNAMVDGTLRWIRSHCEPSHRFTRPGVYEVTFIATNDWGETDQITKRLVIANQAPIANMTFAPLAPTVDDYVTFTDDSFDPDGSVRAYRWDAQGRVGVASSFTHRFTTPGTHTVKLTVQDDAGGNDTIEMQLHVRPGTAALADFFTNPAFPEPGQAVRFTDISRPAAGDRAVSWTWRMADGFESRDQHMTRSFTEEGIYRVTLTVATELGDTLTVERDIVVADGSSVFSVQSAPRPAELAAPLALLLGVALLLAVLGWRNRGQ